MSSTEFDIAPFSFNEASDELAWEDERGRPAPPRRAARPAAARPRPRPRPPRRPAPRRPLPVGGLGLDSVAAPCNCPAHRSEYVRWVQSALNRIDSAGLQVDGVMSPATRSALRAFQTRQSLPADGIAGPDTEQALRNVQRPSDTAADVAAPADEPGELFEFEALEFESGTPTLRNGSRGTAVTDLQRRLAAAGFNPGPSDGIFGAQTDAAVRSFQRARGLSADGIVGPMTWSALLNATPSQPPAPPSPPSGGGGGGAIRYGKGWGGSEGVADAAKAIAASMGIRVTSEKRDLAATIRVGSSTSSDHYTGNTSAYAVDLGVSGTRGDELARAIAAKFGIPPSVIGTYTRTTIQVGDRRYSLQLLWKVSGHFDHVHLGIRRA